MDDQEKAEKAAALRGTLRDGRVSKASTIAHSDDGNHDSAFRATFQDAGREISSLVRDSKQTTDDDRQSTSNGRGTTAESKRVGQSDRRSSESDSSTTSSSASTESARAVGRIVTDEPIPDRKTDSDTVSLNPNKPNATFATGVRSDSTDSKLSSKYPESNMVLSENPSISVRKLAERLGVSVDTAHRIKKEWEETHKHETPKEPLKNPFSGMTTGGKVLTDKEANEITTSFASALQSDFEAIDTYLWMRLKAAGIETNEQPIWSDIDDEEVDALTRLMVRWGKRSPTAATVVRATVESADYIAVGTVFIPRIRNTVDVMRKTRKPRQRRGQSIPDEN